MIWALIEYIAGNTGAGISGIGSDFWGIVYNGIIWYWNFYCQWGC